MAAILRVKDENGNIVSIPAIKGDKGEKGDRGLPGSGGVPDGGTTGQVLTKNSNADGDAGWKEPYTYVLPAATAQTLGGVKIGNGINIAEDGTISSEGSGSASAVLYTEQTLTDEQKTQALANIGGLSKSQGTSNSGKFLGIGADGIVQPMTVSGGGSSEWNLVLDTVINDNQIWQPLTLDRSTGVMTFDKEIPTMDVNRPAGVVPNFSVSDSLVEAWKYIPNEFIEYGFLGTDGVYNSKTTIAETNVNQNVDVTKFHFEKISSVAHAWDGLNCDKIKFQLLAPNMKIWAFNACIVFRIKLTDGTNIEFASTYDTVANHMGLYTINAEAEIKDGILWINVHEQRYTLSERKNANVNGTWKNVFHTENNGYRVSENVKIAGITSTSRANQQSGMYNGTVVRIWEG